MENESCCLLCKLYFPDNLSLRIHLSSHIKSPNRRGEQPLLNEGEITDCNTVRVHERKLDNEQNNKKAENRIFCQFIRDFEHLPKIQDVFSTSGTCLDRSDRAPSLLKMCETVTVPSLLKTYLDSESCLKDQITNTSKASRNINSKDVLEPTISVFNESTDSYLGNSLIVTKIPVDNMSKVNKTSNSLTSFTETNLIHPSSPNNPKDVFIECKPDITYLSDYLCPTSTNDELQEGMTEHAILPDYSEEPILPPSKKNVAKSQFSNVNDCTTASFQANTVGNGKEPFAIDTHSDNTSSLQDKSYKCEICKRFFLSYYHLYCHQFCLENKTIPCFLCGVVAKGHKHINCNLCSSVFSTKRYLWKHYELFHCPKVTSTCGVCHQNRKKRNEHFCVSYKDAVEGGLHINRCEVCTMYFFIPSALRSHYRRTHSTYEMKHLCKFCNATFIKPAKLKEHLFKHGTKLTFQCEECMEIFQLKSSLDAHMEITHCKNTPRQSQCTCGNPCCKFVKSCLSVASTSKSHFKYRQSSSRESSMYADNCLSKCPVENVYVPPTSVGKAKCTSLKRGLKAKKETSIPVISFLLKDKICFSKELKVILQRCDSTKGKFQQCKEGQNNSFSSERDGNDRFDDLSTLTNGKIPPYRQSLADQLQLRKPSSAKRFKIGCSKEDTIYNKETVGERILKDSENDCCSGEEQRSLNPKTEVNHQYLKNNSHSPKENIRSRSYLGNEHVLRKHIQKLSICQQKDESNGKKLEMKRRKKRKTTNNSKRIKKSNSDKRKSTKMCCEKRASYEKMMKLFPGITKEIRIVLLRCDSKNFKNFTI